MALEPRGDRGVLQRDPTNLLRGRITVPDGCDEEEAPFGGGTVQGPIGVGLSLRADGGNGGDGGVAAAEVEGAEAQTNWLQSSRSDEVPGLPTLFG